MKKILQLFILCFMLLATYNNCLAKAGDGGESSSTSQTLYSNCTTSGYATAPGVTDDDYSFDEGYVFYYQFENSDILYEIENFDTSDETDNDGTFVLNDVTYTVTNMRACSDFLI